MSKGRVILIGAGPGDPGLITVRGREALEQADVVIYDYLSNAELLVHARDDAEKIYVGKKANQHTLKQPDINDLLLDKALNSELVVRLKGGDCYVFGRGSEEAMHLIENGVAVEVVPGIPAAVGASAYAGIPLTDRRHTSGVTFLTGSEDPTKPDTRLDWSHIARESNTIVIYMGVKTLPAIAEALIANGKPADTPVGMVEWATMPHQRTVQATLGTIAEVAKRENVKAPALTIIGGVNEFAPALGWFEKRPLHGKKVVVTRSRQQASKLSIALRQLGAAVVEMPVIAITPPDDQQELRDAVADIANQDWVLFTSVNGVDAVFKALSETGGDARRFAGCKVAAIGSATANALKANGISPDFIPAAFTGEALFHELVQQEDMAGKRVLLPRADIAPPLLEKLLADAGAIVTNAVAYRTVPGDFNTEQLRAIIADDDADVVTFTSSSTARFFADGLGADFVAANVDKFAGISIGPVTSKTMSELGIPVAREAEQHDIPGLVQAIRQYLAKEQL
jgi:uroporphyrinogen III methyltransferase/synthase